MGSKTDFLELEILDHVVNSAVYTTPGAVYSALFTVIPSDSTSTGEQTAASSGYTRVVTTFGTASDGSVANTAAVTFATANTAYTVVGWGLYDSATAGTGNLLFWATVTTLAVGSGDQATFAIGNITISED